MEICSSKRRFARRLLSGSAVALALVASPALAQAGPENDAASPNVKAEDPNEIIVTAQKRDEKLLDTPISVGVLTPATLESGGSRGVADYLRRVPAVNVAVSGAGKSVISVRGVESSSVGTTTAGYYQDDAPFAFIRGRQLPNLNGYDIERVEVLRGPQGTLYGVNSLNGVIRVITADADLENLVVKGRGRLSDTQGGGTNYTADGAVSVPVIPGKLAVRAVVGYSNYSGFIDSTFDGGKNINHFDEQNYRFNLNFQPTDAFSLKAGFQRNITDAAADDEALADYTSPFPSVHGDEIRLDLYTLRAQYDIGPVTLTNNFSYIEDDAHQVFYLSPTFRASFNNSLASYNNEFRVSSNGSGSWFWLAGASYKDTKEVFEQEAKPNLAGVLHYTIHSKSYAIFADVTRKLFGDQIEISGGLRYFDDHVVLNQTGSFTVGGALLSNKVSKFNKLTGRALVKWTPSDSAMFYATYGTGFRSGISQTPTALLSTPGLSDAGPDSLSNYEIGAKGSLFGGAVTYETAAYFQKWSDLQQSLRVPFAGVAGGVLAIVNAGDASGFGAEVGITVRPFKGLGLNAGVAYSGLTYDQDVFQFVAASGTNVLLFGKGDRINDSVEWNFSLGADLQTPISEKIDLYAKANYNRSSPRLRRDLSGTVLTVTRSDAIDMVNAELGFDIGAISLGIFGDNLLNWRGNLGLATSGQSQRLRGRTIGVVSSFKF